MEEKIKNESDCSTNRDSEAKKRNHWGIIIKSIPWALLGIFLIPILGIFICDCFGWYVCELYTFGIKDLKDTKGTKDFFEFWITLFGAIGVAYTVYISYQRVKQTEKSIEQNQISIRLNKEQIDKNFDLQRADQRENRFAKAIELLGNSNSSVRTGAVYSLHSLAKDFEDRKEIVFDILCSHVRTLTSTEEYKTECRRKAEKADSKIEMPSDEIQTILNLIINRKDSDGKFPKHLYEGLKLDLSGAYFSGADFSGADLTGADLKRVNLTGADLNNAYLIRADLNNAYLISATYSNMDQNSKLIISPFINSADLRQVDLSWAVLSGAVLKTMNDIGVVDLSNANLFEAKFLIDSLTPEQREIVVKKGAILYNEKGERVDKDGNIILVKEKK